MELQLSNRAVTQGGLRPDGILSISIQTLQKVTVML